MSTGGIKDSDIVIVGASLTGYTLAASLAEAGCKNITVYDGREDPKAFENDRAYSQVFYENGMGLIRKLPGFNDVFKQEAVCQHIRVVNDISASGKQSISSFRPPAGPIYWILKSRMLEMLDSYVKERYPQVKIVTSSPVEDIVFVKSDSEDEVKRAKLVVGGADQTQETIELDMLFACDGFNSTIRKLMTLHDDQIDSTHGMDIYSKTVPSSGLRHRGITLSEQPIISAPGEEIQYAEPSVVYYIRGETSERPKTSVFDICLLPVASGKDEKRRAALIVEDGNRAVTVSDVDEALALFRENFPQLRVDDVFSRDEMQKFVDTTASVFPPVQRPMSLTGNFRNTTKPSGMMFVGDAAHSFPPDAGQGTQSSFMDVEAIFDIVNGAYESTTWNDIMTQYEKARDKETWALLDIVKVSTAFVYNQNKFGHFRFMWNKRIRAALNNIIPFAFSEDMDSLVRRGMTYRAVKRRNRITTISMTALAAALIAVPFIAFKSASDDEDINDED